MKEDKARKWTAKRAAKKSGGSHQMPDGSMMAGASHSSGAMGPMGPQGSKRSKTPFLNYERMRLASAKRQSPDSMGFPTNPYDARPDDLINRDGYVYGAPPARQGLLGQPYADAERIYPRVQSMMPMNRVADPWDSPEGFASRIAEARRRYEEEQRFLRNPAPQPIYNEQFRSDYGY